MTLQARTVNIVKNLLVENDKAAGSNRARFADAGVLAVNLIAAPGAGKTSLIQATLTALPEVRIGVIEGDIAGDIDTEKVLAAGAAQAVQINTGGTCHLEADMVAQALPELDLSALDIVFIENVGNLICPTAWDLGEGLKVCLSSVAEGDDKPVKYPTIFAKSDVVVLNKVDLIDLVDFDRAFFYSTLQGLNPAAVRFELSSRTGQGVSAWAAWLNEANSRWGAGRSCRGLCRRRS